ncbi:MAG: hypothetical protein IKA77_05360 [Clostridia bacterium]|nr:hypothetical protein [Clostridia bacterium]
MKRKIALVICLIMIATMVMTVLVACGEKKMDLSLLGETINKFDSVTVGKNENLIVDLGELGHYYGYHYFSVKSDKEVATIELQSSVTGLGDWKTIKEFNNVNNAEHVFNMMGYPTYDQNGFNIVSVTCSKYRLYITNGNSKTKIKVSFERYLDVKEVTVSKYKTSYYWKPNTTHTASVLEIPAFETISQLFLSVAESQKLGRILSNSSFNNAIRELSKDATQNEYRDMFWDALSEASNAMTSADSLTSARKIFFSELFAQVISKAVGVLLFKAELKSLAKVLKAATVPQMVIFQKPCNPKAGDMYSIESCEVPCYKNKDGKLVYILMGSPTYKGEFKKY